MERDQVDVLVVGAGLAGLATALSAAGRRVTILCPELPPAAAASVLAQGGIAAAVGAGDSPAQHAEDTLRAGAGLCDPEAVRILCGEAPFAIRWLEEQGVVFDRAGTDWSLHSEAAHGRPRVLHAGGDATGAALSSALQRAARRVPLIELRAGCTAYALDVRAGQITGVTALNIAGRPLRIEARDTVLATGGLGQLFLHSTNPLSACGDGLAMALEAGARCEGLEFVQFHPTALACEANPMPLVTEALRGAGATLIDAHGERFMRGAHPSAELAPRDVVAREIWRRTSSGREVFLDARAVFAADSAAFPSVRALCARFDVDVAHEPIPVVPAAHYHMGGIAVDLEGRASLAQLWACGEVASTGVHGANRLASNSLLEAVVFGRRLGAALAAQAGRSQLPSPGSRRAGAAVRAPLEAALEVDARLWGELRQLMWIHLGILRDAAGLETGVAAVAQLERDLAPGQIRLAQRLRLARAMLAAALARRESCGAHFRTDAVLVTRDRALQSLDTAGLPR